MSEPLEAARSLQRLGPYHLVKRLAAGGSAEIYLGFRDNGAGFKKFYAIKVLRGSSREREDLEILLSDEAKLLAQLDHPNIVSVHDYGRSNEVTYLVMDYVHGADLGHLLSMAKRAGVRFPDVISAWIVAEVCEGLGYAHSRTHPDGRTLALVHRDISPPNILVGFEGEVRITDFGVATSSVPGRSETRTGVIKGKLQYMPPEYAVGNLQDGRGDIFATGLVLFELLSNRLAYADSAGIDQMVEAIREGSVPDLSTFRPDLDPEILQIVRRAVQPNRNHRYQTAEEMAADLRGVVSRLAPSMTRSTVRNIVRELYSLGEVEFPEVNALLGPTLEANGLEHLVEIARNQSREELVAFDFDEELDDWAVAPTSSIPTSRLEPDQEATDPNVPPPRILSPSGYLRDVDENERGRHAEAAATKTDEFEGGQYVIPASQIEPLDDEPETNRIDGDEVSNLTEPQKR